ncbi:hypothetical protein Scep_001376 [Stephania cephalantha]|uniref:MaoC-like domain-containing protein n=1 Tax=Stephania cephalantha TaxID=152367 RepID=A0AAP0LAM9_9MAGN
MAHRHSRENGLLLHRIEELTGLNKREEKGRQKDKGDTRCVTSRGVRLVRPRLEGRHVIEVAMIANRLIPNLRSFSSSSAPRILHIGDVLTSSKQFSDQDVLQFSNLTLDFNPLHFDPHIARESGFRDRIVHGILVASLFPRTIAFNFAGAVYVSQSLQFKSPVYVGERVVAEVRPVQLRQNKDR